jgi:hypothetical protein
MSAPRFDPDRARFFLGGQDLEMVTIAALLRGRLGPDAVCDKRLAWGAKASDHAIEIEAAAKAGLTPVLIELTPDIGLPAGSIEIDHHGARAGEPCALRQVFDLLALPEADWTRHFALVAANDTGHVAAMRRMGASEAEIAEIRAADRAAQGVTLQEEQAGQAALAAAESALDGALIVITLPHGRSATVMDPLAIAGETRDVLILSPTMTQFFGQGARIAALDAAFPGGWRGGELPRRGFWGSGRALTIDAVLAVLQAART